MVVRVVGTEYAEFLNTRSRATHSDWALKVTTGGVILLAHKAERCQYQCLGRLREHLEQFFSDDVRVILEAAGIPVYNVWGTRTEVAIFREKIKRPVLRCTKEDDFTDFHTSA